MVRVQGRNKKDDGTGRNTQRREEDELGQETEGRRKKKVVEGIQQWREEDELEEETEEIRRKTVVEGIQQRREKDELGRGDGRNKTVVEEEKKMSWEENTEGIRRKTIADGIQQWREEDELGRGDGRNKKEDGSGRNTTKKRRR